MSGIDYRAILDSGLEQVLVLSSGFVIDWLFELPFSLTSLGSEVFEEIYPDLFWLKSLDQFRVHNKGSMEHINSYSKIIHIFCAFPFFKFHLIVA